MAGRIVVRSGMPLGEELQQPTWPPVMHIRKCTHRAPILSQSSQPCADGVTSRTWSMCEQPSM
jgi:hypothetical protein